MIRSACVFLACLLMTACAGQQPLVRTVKVEVPVPVPCRAPPVPKPAWESETLPAGADDYQWVRSLLVEIKQRQAYEARLEAALAACR